MPDAPEILYARSGDVHIAYQVVGDGPVDLVYTPGIWSNLEIMWEWPEWSRYLYRLAAFSRLILFDMRGVGLSDRGAERPRWSFRWTTSSWDRSSRVASPENSRWRP